MKRHLLLYALLLAGAAASVPAQTLVDLRTQAKSIDFSNVSITRPFHIGAGLPSTCTPGDAYLRMDASAGQNVYVCTAANTWTVQGTGTVNANYAQSFSAATSVTLTHNLNTSNILVQCYDSTNTAIEFNSFSIAGVNAATVTFAAPQSGRCVINGGSGSGGSGSGSGASGSGTGTVTNSLGSLTNDLPVFGNGGSDVKAGTKTGTNNQVVVSQSPTILSPLIADLTNMTHTHASAAMGGQLGLSAIQSSALSGTGAKLATTAGILTAGHCAQIDSNGNFTDAGNPCGTGSSSGSTSLTIGLGLQGNGAFTSPLQVDTTAVGTRLSASANLDFAVITNGSCAELPIPLTGAMPGDEVFLGAPPDVNQGFIWNGYVSAANVVTVRFCNFSGSSVDPTPRAWRATIVRSF